jgi:hypothetical protein
MLLHVCGNVSEEGGAYFSARILSPYFREHLDAMQEAFHGVLATSPGAIPEAPELER